MKLLQRKSSRADARSDEYHAERPPADEAPEPQPEHGEPRIADPGLTDLSKRDYFAILRRAIKKFNQDHMTNIAAALAYYAFLAIPSALFGAAIAWLLFNGDAVVTGGLNIHMAVTTHEILIALAWALAIGLVGGFLPALRAADMPVATALRAS